MFTGIVETTGHLARMERHGEDRTLEIHAPRSDFTALTPGESIAVNGICLTVVSCVDEGFTSDVSVETRHLTTLSHWRLGQRVNLERALTPATLLGGHLVSGHVDGVAIVVARTPEERSMRLTFRAPAPLAKYIAVKGSITLDGTSLTVNHVDGAEFAVNIVPHTQARTIIADYRTGTEVNLEVDLLARYLERLLAAGAPANETEASGKRNSGEHFNL